MGGKTGTTTQSVQIPPEVLARYNSVNATAEKTAATPFQQYSTDPNAFVAPLNQQQQAGISNINQQANAAQPAYGAAMQGTAQAYQGYNAPNYQSGVAGYMNPFVNQAMGSTAAYLQNQNQQQQQQLLGQGISAGAFGGDRGKVAQAALMGQQNLAMGNTLSNMANTGYQQSAQNYLAGLGQQGALSAQMGALGAGAQQAGLQGAQAQLGAGTLGQQTTQAGNTALYNQFLQQQAYPFQVSQFLANIAEGTGALSGSTTTTQQPMSFFSDRRLKHDIKRVGTAENGLPIYKFKYKGDDSEQTHVGFMADEVEKIHPEAVGLAGGYKTVDYDKASEPVHKYAGGLVSEGGAVGQQHMGQGFADGGYADYYDPNSIQNIISRHQGMYANIDSHHVPFARDLAGGIGKHGRVPQGSLPVGSLMKAGAIPQQQQDDALGRAQQLSNLGETGTKYYDKYKEWQAKQAIQQQSEAQKGRTPEQGFNASDSTAGQGKVADLGLARGGHVHGYALGGDALTDPKKKDEGTPEGLYAADQSGTLNIPNENKMNKLMQASGPTGTMQDPTMADIQKMAAMAAMFMKAGGGSVGREHHDGSEGNVVGDETPKQAAIEKALALPPPVMVKSERPSNTALGLAIPEQRAATPEPTAEEQRGSPNFAHAVHRTLQFEGGLNPNDTNGTPSKFGINQAANPDVYDSVKTPSDASQVYYNRYWKPLGADQMDPKLAHVAFDTAVISGVGKAKELIAQANNDPEKLLQLRKEFQDNLIAKNPEKYGKYEKAWNNRVDQLRTDIGNKLDLPQQQGLAVKAEEPTKEKKGGLGDFFTAENVVPLLSGLAGMASSRSPYLGSAILEGLGAGANAYMGTRKSQAEIDQAKAATKSIEADTLKGSLVTTRLGSYVWVKTPAGPRPIPYSQWDAMPEGQKPSMAFAPPNGADIAAQIYEGGSQPSGGATTQQPTGEPTTQQPAAAPTTTAPAQTKIGEIPATFNFDDQSTSAAKADRNSINPLSMGEDAGQQMIKTSGKYFDTVNTQANSARANTLPLREMSSNLANGTTLKGASTPGVGFGTRAFINSALNTFARMTGSEEIKGGDSADAIQRKINTINGALTAQGANEHSLAAFNQLISANPNLDMPPEAYAPLMALMLVQNRRSIDQSEHLNKWAQNSNGTFFGAPQDFERVSKQRYADEQNALSDLILKHPKEFQDMMNGRDANGRVMTPTMVEDALNKTYHVRGLSRYFVGGQ
jgi:lysozyme family protein